MDIIKYDGKPITKPGIYSDVPIEGPTGYHGNPNICDGWSISSTGIKQIFKRPSEYWCNSPYNPDQVEQPSKKHFNFGKAAHTLLLGEEEFSKRYSLQPDQYKNDKGEAKKWNNNANACKEWNAHQAEHDRTIVTADDIKHIKGMQKTLSNHPVVQNGIMNGLVEHSMFVKRGSIWLRCRPDNIPVISGDVNDLKTTADVAYDNLMKSIFNFGYNVQAAIVKECMEELMPDGFEFNNFSFTFIETKPPYDARIVRLREADIELGTRQLKVALQIMEKCIEENRWPGEEGFEQSINDISMPAWANTNIENHINYIKEML